MGGVATHFPKWNKDTNTFEPCTDAGTPAGNCAAFKSDNKCRACKAGFKLANGVCAACGDSGYNDGTAAECGTAFKCPGGTAASGTATTNAVYKCSACTAPYVLSVDKCVPGDSAKARIGLPLKHGLLLAENAKRADLTAAIQKAVADYLAATLPNKLGGLEANDIHIGTPTACTAANTALGCPSDSTNSYASVQVSLANTEGGTATAAEIANALTTGTTFNKVLLYTPMGTNGGTVGDNVEAEDWTALNTLQLRSAQATSTTAEEEDDSSGMSGGEIAGIIIGSIVFVGLVVYMMRKRSGSGGGGGMRPMRMGGKGAQRRVNWQPINDRV